MTNMRPMPTVKASIVTAKDLPEAIEIRFPSRCAPRAPNRGTQISCDTPKAPGATPLGSDQLAPGAQTARVAADLSGSQTSDGAQRSSASGQLNGSQYSFDAHSKDAAVELQFCAAFLDDVENLRKATENRIRAFEQAGFSGDAYRSQLDALSTIEHEAVLALQRQLRKHPLGPWVKRTIGVGEKQGARLIAAISDITYNHAEDRPRRGVAELWAYCGFRPDQKRRKGVRSNWNPDAKMRAFLIAESCLKAKARSPYGPVYDSARASWAAKDTTELHKHNHALRCVAKAVLKDLFIEAQKVDC